MLMLWERVTSLDAGLRTLAAAHYSRQTPDSVQLAPPGRRVYFATPCRRALWASSRQQFAAPHRLGSWVCTFFRNEGAGLSSELIVTAVAATRFMWGEPPSRGMATEIDAGRVRRKRDPGRCYRRAGFLDMGERTKGGLIVLRLPVPAFPAALAPLGELALEFAS